MDSISLLAALKVMPAGIPPRQGAAPQARQQHLQWLLLDKGKPHEQCKQPNVAASGSTGLMPSKADTACHTDRLQSGCFFRGGSHCWTKGRHLRGGMLTKPSTS